MRLALLAILAAALIGCGSAAPAVATPAQTVLPIEWTPEPQPTPDPAAVTDPNAGRVVFGAKASKDGLTISSPKSSFGRNARKIAWVAYLSEPAGATKLTIMFLRKRGASERLLDSGKWDASPDWTVAGSTGDLAGIVGNKAGTYVMRLARGSTVLAEGTFKLTK